MIGIELLDGFLIAYLNLDRVIEIIRAEDEPKPVLMAEFSLSDRQAEAILNMRLRSLRRLEEMEIGRERAALAKEREELVKLVESPARQRTPAQEGPADAQGQVRRRSPDADRGGRAGARDRLVGDDREGADHRHPVAARLDPGDEGPPRARRRSPSSSGARATGRSSISTPRPPTGWRSSLPMAGSTRWPATSCPSARGFGEPVRLFIDLDGRGRHRPAHGRPARHEAADRLVGRQGLRHQRRCNARRDAQRQAAGQPAAGRAGRRRPAGSGRRRCGRGRSARTARCSSSRLPSFPNWRAGRASRLQRYRDGGLSDAVAFRLADGLAGRWAARAGGSAPKRDLTPWRAARGAAGRMPPIGFPRDNRFG